MSDKIFIKDLKQNKRVESIFSVKYKHPPREYKNGLMFVLGLADKTGEIEATYWGGANHALVRSVYDSFKESDVVTVSGVVSTYRDKPRIDINEDSCWIKRTEDYELVDFVAETKNSVDEMMDFVKKTIDSITDPHLAELLNSFFSDKKFAGKFKTMPGAMYIHHAYIGGLLEHTVNVIKIAELINSIYPALDRNLLMTGAILHDIGKIKEFAVTTNIKITEEGMLRGHIVLGEEMLLERINKIENFPDTLKMKTAHIILSHHGNGEYGSPRAPQFPEAIAVHKADELDSQVEQHVSFWKKAKDSTEDFRTYSKRLGQIYLK